MYKVSCYGHYSQRLITTKTYATRRQAQRVARSWARWSVLHCDSAHGMARGSGYTRWDYKGRTIYEEELPGVRRAVIEEKLAVRSVSHPKIKSA